MPESILFLIARMVSRKAGVGLGSVVVGELEGDSFHGPQIIVGFLGTGREGVGFSFLERGQKIQRELVLGKIKLVNQGKAEVFGIEWQRLNNRNRIRNLE